MKFKNWREFAYLLMMYAAVQWFILFFLATIFYAGGTYANPNSPGYDFFSNYNSDLGRTVAHSGKSNTISFIIFTINHAIFASSLILFFIALHYLFSEKGIAKSISLVGTIFGVIAGIGFLGAVFTPWDLHAELHELFNSIGSFALLLVVIMYSIAIYLNEDYPNHYAYVQVIYTAFVVIYVILLFTGPSLSSPEGIRLQATWQKIILFLGMINVFIQGYGAWKLETF